MGLGLLTRSLQHCLSLVTLLFNADEATSKRESRNLSRYSPGMGFPIATSGTPQKWSRLLTSKSTTAPGHINPFLLLQRLQLWCSMSSYSFWSPSWGHRRSGSIDSLAAWSFADSSHQRNNLRTSHNCWKPWLGMHSWLQVDRLS